MSENKSQFFELEWFQSAAWRHGEGPLHQRLTEALRSGVRHSALPGGLRLPAERVLADRLGVSRTTVLAAYAQLQSEGLLERRRGSGTYVSAMAALLEPASGVTAGVFAGRRPAPMPEAIDLSIAAPGPHPEVTAALIRAAEEAAGLSGHHGYLTAGLPALREAIAGRYEGEGVPTAADEILVTSGGQQAISLLCRLLLGRGETALIESPNYPGLLEALRVREARWVAARIRGEGLRAGAVRRLLVLAQPRLIWVTPSFQNPTGTVLPMEERAELLRLAADRQIPLIEDQVLRDLAFEGPPSPMLAGQGLGTVVSIGSLSKTCWGGLRVGWVRGPRAVIAQLTRLRAVADLGGPLVEQLAALHLLPQLDRIGEARRAQLRLRRDHLASLLRERLPEWEWQLPTGGVCLWVRLPGADAVAFAELADGHGVHLAPGTDFAAGDGWSDYVRLPFMLEEPVLDRAVTTLAEAWERYRTDPRSAPGDPVRAVV
ncbi:MAG TPA: PLP-dependent aminotransferase family protein [Candidatus Dormibacteraeota bacterium]|jgi:DNA-binding transcriptional MocR family regulator|nr:PLP-dependent aminotransferase family protein [Candidatus Dormibacteraeota bacterium]